MWAIIKKEVKLYFLSPIGYVFIGAFMFASSYFFYQFIFQSGSVEYPSLFYYTIELLTFTIPLLTMAMFAGERKNGTETLLLTSSRSITSIVLGKFLAAFMVIVITAIFSLMYYVIVCIFAHGLTNVPQTITTIIGFLLVAMAYLSVGMFISSLTENQIISGVATIVLLLISMFIPNLSENLGIISPVYLFSKYPNGILAVEESITLLSLTAMFILLTIIVMQRRKVLK